MTESMHCILAWRWPPSELTNMALDELSMWAALARAGTGMVG